MSTDFENYLIDHVAASIDGFYGDLEHYDRMHGSHIVEISELEDHDWMTYDHVGYWLMELNQYGVACTTRYRTFIEMVNADAELSALYDDYLQSPEMQDA